MDMLGKSLPTLADLTAKRDGLKRAVDAANAEIAELNARQREEWQRLAEQERAAHPVLDGNAMAVLLHHFGASACNSSVKDPLVDLETKINAARQTGYPVPVLFVNSFRDNRDGEEFLVNDLAMVNVDPTIGAPLLRSVAKVERRKIHAFTEEQGNVQELSLYLLGKTAVYSGKMYSGTLRAVSSSDACRLRRETKVEGGGVMPSTYTLSDFVDDDVMNFAQKHIGTFNRAVGWHEIGEYVSSIAGDRLPAYNNIWKMLQEVGIDSYGPPEAPIREVLRAVHELVDSRKKIEDLAQRR